MADQTDGAEAQNQTMFERWQDEQRNWQRLIMDYVDKASTDEAFLTNLGNAMRGSLLVNKPYPGTAVGPIKAADEPQSAALDEVVFAVRRLEGQVLDLTMAVESLVTRSAPDSTPKSSQPDEAGPDHTTSSQ